MNPRGSPQTELAWETSISTSRGQAFGRGYGVHQELGTQSLSAHRTLYIADRWPTAADTPKRMHFTGLAHLSKSGLCPQISAPGSKHSHSQLPVERTVLDDLGDPIESEDEGSSCGYFPYHTIENHMRVLRYRRNLATRVLQYRRELAHRDIVRRVNMVCAAQLGVSAAVVSDPTCAMNSSGDLLLLQVQVTLTALHTSQQTTAGRYPQHPAMRCRPA